MKVIICGAGQVGWQIARHLSGENNDVTVVDNNPDLVARAMETLDVQGVTGFASYPDVLERAGARDADMLVAATHSDEVNMVTCQVAHSIFNIPRKIARLRAQSYLDAIYSDLYRREHLPIDVVISPEREVALAVLRRLSRALRLRRRAVLRRPRDAARHPDRRRLPGGQHAAAPAHRSVHHAQDHRRRRAPRRRAVRAREHRPDLSRRPGLRDDRQRAMSNRTLEVFGKEVKRQDRVVILGGGNVGLAVAEALERRSDRVRAKIIELDRDIAERAADSLERTVVLHGNAMDIELLKEAGIARADAVLAVTDDDKVNMLASVRGKAAGCPMAICLINDTSLIPLMGPLDIDAHVNPRGTTVSSILRHIRHGRVRWVYSVGDAEAEVIEAQVLSTSPIAGHAIRDIEFPEGVLVGARAEGRHRGQTFGRDPDRGRRRGGDLRHGGGCARGRAPVAGLGRLLLRRARDVRLARPSAAPGLADRARRDWRCSFPAAHAAATGEARIAEVFFWFGTLTAGGGHAHRHRHGGPAARRPSAPPPRRACSLLFVACRCCSRCRSTRRWATPPSSTPMSRWSPA